MDVDKIDGKGATALHYAVYVKNNADCVRLLLQHKASPNIVALSGTEDNPTPLSIAVYFKNRDLVKLLLEDGHCDLDIKNRSGETVLFRANRSETWSCVGLLLAHGAAPFIPGGERDILLVDIAREMFAPPHILQLIEEVTDKHLRFRLLHRARRTNEGAIHVIRPLLTGAHLANLRCPCHILRFWWKRHP